MAMLEVQEVSGFPEHNDNRFHRKFLPDGNSISLTIDFSDDIKLIVNANKTPKGLKEASATVQNSNGGFIQSTVSLNGKKVTWVFDSTPPMTIGQFDSNNFGDVVVTFFFDSN